jgi:hypothetical protein
MYAEVTVLGIGAVVFLATENINNARAEARAAAASARGTTTAIQSPALWFRRLGAAQPSVALASSASNARA